MWLVFQRIHIGSFALLLPLSEVILSGGPWRSSIIPHPDTFGNPFFTFFVPFCVFDFLTSFSTAIYTFLDVEAAVASEVIFLYIIRYCSIQTSREVYTAVDITPRNANTFLAQFVKSFGLKFCSKILGSILAKPPKHKM